jgi:hypothetical protein
VRRTCQFCGRELRKTARKDTLFCNSTCKSRNHRAPRAQVTEMPLVTEHPLVIAAHAELEIAGQLGTPEAMMVIELAERMADRDSSGTGLVALSKQLSRAMAAARGTPPAPRPRLHDELTVRRAERQKRGYGGRR